MAFMSPMQYCLLYKQQQNIVKNSLANEHYDRFLNFIIEDFLALLQKHQNTWAQTILFSLSIHFFVSEYNFYLFPIIYKNLIDFCVKSTKIVLLFFVFEKALKYVRELSWQNNLD